MLLFISHILNGKAKEFSLFLFMFFRKISYLILFFAMSFTFAQITIRISNIPQDTPLDATLYMASNLNGWNPKDENYAFKKQSDGSFTLAISSKESNVEYKITQGSWDVAEGDANGNSIENRKIEINSTTPKTMEITVESWQKKIIKKSTTSKNVKILSESFDIPQLKTTRKVWIYLPEDYHTFEARYPVIYMADGQNLFDEATSYSGEWRVDETMDSLKTLNKINAIVVGIDNGGSERLNEYSPWKNEQYGGGHGDAFADFLAQTLKPYIDTYFKTKNDAQNTALIGSSMGGLISLYTGVKYPEKFGKLGVFSPALWFSEADLKTYVQKNSSSLKNTKIYFVAGQNESKEMVNDINEIVEILKTKGLSNQNLNVKIDEKGTHSEGFWAQQLPDALLWLFH